VTLKLGLYISSFGAEDDTRSRLDEIIDQVRLARDSGFRSVWAAQHYLSRPLQMFQALPLLSRLIPETHDMAIGPNILVLPLLNPAVVAEESATMDYLSGGRYVLGVGLGYRAEEFELFHVAKSERVGRMTEAIGLIRRLWTEEVVEHEGEFFRVPAMGLSVRPIRPKGPPIWIGASVDPAIRRAARLGDAWLITFYPSVQWLSRQMIVYRQALAETGKSDPEEMPILRECYVSPVQKAALEECRSSLEVKYRVYASWGQDRFLPEGERFDQPFDKYVEDRFIIGEPSFVREEIERYHETLGVNHFILRIYWPGLEQEKVLRTLRLLGKHVIPFLT
jgi:alkanesulfonate monooxygenase SsuD/methylene tetrahydromethanopterin reductase-like flavin-dependent oxidoreductase (luciferase family)